MAGCLLCANTTFRTLKLEPPNLPACKLMDCHTCLLVVSDLIVEIVVGALSLQSKKVLLHPCDEVGNQMKNEELRMKN